MYQARPRRLWWVWTCSFRRLPSPTLPGMSTPSTGDLLARAAAGDQPAWDALVDRYCRLVWSVLGSFMLGVAAREDVYQTVWLRLVEHLDRIKDPERLAGWLATTTRNEALRVQRQQRRVLPTEHMPLTADPTASTPEEQVADAETREIALRGFGQLSESCQQLLRLLTVDPPLDYATVAEMLGRPIGSLGPTRARCLGKLRILMAEVD